MKILIPSLNREKPRNLPACHWKSPRHKEWVSRVEQLESEGLDRSDAQGIADMEFETIKK